MLAEAIRTTPVDGESRAFVEGLRREALAHRSVRHPYLLKLQTTEFTEPAEAVRQLCYQYWGYSSWFQRYLLGTISQCESNKHRALLFDSLREEAGNLSGDEEAQLLKLGIRPEWVRGTPHPELYRRFLAALGNGELDEIEGRLREPVLIWRELMWRLCSQSGSAIAVGALGLGTECIVRVVYEPWMKAIGRHIDVAPKDRVFFDLHAHVDDEHAAVFEGISVEVARTEEGRKALRLGMLSALYLRGAFFDAMDLHSSGASGARQG